MLFVHAFLAFVFLVLVLVVLQSTLSAFVFVLLSFVL